MSDSSNCETFEGGQQKPERVKFVINGGYDGHPHSQELNNPEEYDLFFGREEGEGYYYSDESDNEHDDKKRDA